MQTRDMKRRQGEVNDDNVALKEIPCGMKAVGEGGKSLEAWLLYWSRVGPSVKLV